MEEREPIEKYTVDNEEPLQYVHKLEGEQWRYEHKARWCWETVCERMRFHVEMIQNKSGKKTEGDSPRIQTRKTREGGV